MSGNGTGSRPKRSRLWAVPDTEFIELAMKCKTVTGLCEALGIARKGEGRKRSYGNGYYIVRERIEALGLTEHFVKSKNTKMACFLLDVDSLKTRSSLKQRIVRDKLLPYECKACGNQGQWMSGPLALQLHHKNGDGKDHRLENVCFLCPNCHSQTENFTGRNKGARKKQEGPC